MCMICFSGDPIEGDPKSFRANTFDTSMANAFCVKPCTCISSCICIPCAAFIARKRVLIGNTNDPDWIDRYTCCQGYADTPCLRAGNCLENKCGTCCLLIESCCCPGPSISSSRAYLAEQYEIKPDPCDNQLIRFSNCLQLLSCLCDLLALCINDSFRECRLALNCLAQVVFHTTFGCMSAQLFKELEIRKEDDIPTVTTSGGTGVSVASSGMSGYDADYDTFRKDNYKASAPPVSTNDTKEV